MGTYEKRGYLNSEFRLFHLTDTRLEKLDFHYHDFDKIMIFIKGKVTYMIEGKSYDLKPYDIVLVNHNDIHRPVVDPSVPYERIIVYISPGFITAYQTADYDLNFCFEQAKKEYSNVLRIHSEAKQALLRITKDLENSFLSPGYAGNLYQQVLFLEFMIHLNRAALDNHLEYLNTDASNQKIIQIMQYISDHLTEELNIDNLAEQFFISRYYMMRLFKSETGYTIGNYINYKRLLIAKEAIAQGTPITQACFDCGFRDYSTFSRAYKKLFGKSPRETQEAKNSRSDN